MTTSPDTVALLGGLHTELCHLRAELVAVEAAIAAREAEAILVAESPAADASLALVQRCLDDMLLAVRADVRTSVEEPAEWAAAEQLRVARRRAEAVRAGTPVSAEGFDAFWAEQDDVLDGRRRTMASLAPMAVPVGAALLGAAALLRLV